MSGKSTKSYEESIRINKQCNDNWLKDRKKRSKKESDFGYFPIKRIGGKVKDSKSSTGKNDD